MIETELTIIGHAVDSRSAPWQEPDVSHRGGGVPLDPKPV